MVTVLLPMYNAEKYLQQCLDSIFRQRYINFELLVINDSSIDGIEQIIKSCKDPRLVYTKNKNNQGVASTLNKGLALAKGKYIARIDADDIMMPDRLCKQVAFMESNPTHVLLGCGHYLINENGLPVDRFLPTDKHEKLRLTYCLVIVFRTQR